MDPTPQDPAPWAARIRALKHASPFQAFSVVMVAGGVHHVSRPEYVEVTEDGWCAKISGPDGLRSVLALEWVVGVEIGGEVGEPPRPPRYAAKMRALQQEGPKSPLVLTMKNGRQFSLAGPHEYLLSPNGRRIAVFDQDGGGVILETCEIADMEPGP